MSRKHYFKTKDLVTIALMGCIGAALSTYIGYLGHAVGAALGLPVGGQMLTGLHVFWFILILAVVDKKGAGLLGAILNSVVQFLMGSHLGVFVLPVGLLEGVFAELGYWPLKWLSRPLAFMVAGGLSACSNLLVIHFVMKMYPDARLFGAVCLVAFGSGVVFAGLLALGIAKLLAGTGLVRQKKRDVLTPEIAESPAAKL